jgi:hypothetical protein
MGTAAERAALYERFVWHTFRRFLMKKKIALILALIMLTNNVIWADDIIWAYVIGYGVGLVLVTLIPIILYYSEAEPEDTDLKLASMPSSQSVPENGFSSALKVLQHVDLGVTSENRTYVGLRFQF